MYTSVLSVLCDLSCPYPQCTMVRWWNCNWFVTQWWKHTGTMVKTQWHDGENAMVRWWIRDVKPSFQRSFTIVFSPSSHDDFIILPSGFYHRTMAFSPSFHYDFTIIPLCCHHRTMAFSPWYHCALTIMYHRVFTMVPSSFHHHAIAFSPSYRCVFTILPLTFGQYDQYTYRCQILIRQKVKQV
jgi:hypothetical protein